MTSFGALRKRPLILALVALAAVALLALACEEEEKEAATPTPTVTRTPTATPAGSPTPTALKPGAAGIASNPREVKGLEGIYTLDDGLAMFKTRPAGENRTGVTATTIKIGHRSTMSGPVATVVGLEFLWSAWVDEIIKRVNEAGGIHGRKIELVDCDDQFNPALAIECANRLIQQDKVFATLLDMGGVPHFGAHSLYEAAGVPELAMFGTSFLKASAEAMDWSRGYPVPTTTDFPAVSAAALQAVTLVGGLWQAKPDAKVAIVYVNASDGLGMLEGARALAADQGKKFVAEIQYESTQLDLTSQVQQAIESGADAIAHLGYTNITLIKALRETFGRKDILVADRGGYNVKEFSQLVDGVLYQFSGPTDVVSPDDPAVKKIQQFAQETKLPFHSVVLAALIPLEWTFRALEMAGPDLTREGLIEALETGFDGSWTCSLCWAPIYFSRFDHWSIEAFGTARWDHALQSYCSVKTAPGQACWGAGGPQAEMVSYETSLGKGPQGNWPGYDCGPPSAEFPKGTCPWKER